MLFAVLLFGVLAFGPQVVLSLDFTFQLSEVKQCEPVSISFKGNDKANAIPMWLTLIPFSSSPISIPIPNAAVNTSGVLVTFMPFAAGTTFVASLDDATGENVAKVSDIIRVLPSPSNDSTCLPASQDTVVTHFTLDNSTFSQCESFTLNYNRTIISRAPSARFYNPKGPSSLLNVTSDDPETGTATYLLKFNRSKEVVLVFDDGLSHRESSALMSIGGDSASSKQCLGSKKSNNNGSQSSSKTSFGISQGVIIGSAVGGGVVVLISICMVLFVIRERRRRDTNQIQFNPSLLEKGRSSNPPRSPPPSSPTMVEKDSSPGFVKDPPYTAEKFLSPTTAFYPRESMASWTQSTPEDQRFPNTRGNDAYNTRDASDRLSLHSLDIEGILNLATVQSNRSSRLTAEPAPLGPALQSLEPIVHGPQLTIPGQLYPSRGHLRDPSDVPFGATSMASAISLTSVVDPFADNATKQRGSARTPYRQSSLDSPIRPPPSAVIGLPSSPRHGPRFSRERGLDTSEIGQKSSNRSTKDSKGDYYGFAR
ncbi:hypothetical protein D9615_003014 [Tricholomella constricta]|uniref:Uncharacterized protein n=1 Tax=Tricholomella constricta TaxID=117010 RepID=A0A8H5M6M4_9AGAR|nr:hypothetical protein D9615_003014 [Tricholomella constricta]